MPVPTPPKLPKGDRLYPARLFQASPVPCPNCNQPVTGFVGVRDLYPAVPDASDRMRASKIYTLYPCFCEVDQHWAATFDAEADRRDRGFKPRDVQGRSAESRERFVAEVEEQLCRQYILRDAAVAADLPGKQAEAEREICLLITELASATPGPHNAARPVRLEPRILQWAKAGGLDTPPPAEDDDDEAVSVLTLDQIKEFLVNDREFMAAAQTPGEGAKRATSISRGVYQELRDFVSAAKPVSRLTHCVVTGLVPSVAELLVVRLSGDAAPALGDPRTDFLDDIARRRQRRLLRPKLPPDEPESA